MKRFVLSLLIFGAALPVAAQEPLVVPRASGPITIDGHVDEPAWAAIDPLPVVVELPTEGAEPSERTEFRVAHDGGYLYVSGRLYDTEPDRIQRTSLQRDDSSLASDLLGVFLDTFDDDENMVGFITKPTGVRTDATTSDDGRNLDFSWDTFWDAAVSVTDEGWFAEIRIPFTSLRFEDERGRVAMGVTIWRWIARKREVIAFPAIPSRWGMAGPMKASLAHDVIMEGVSARDPLYVSPYVLAGASRSHRLNESGTAYDGVDTTARDAGLDLKYGLARNLTLDVTVNTDFAQAEADDEQVNLTRFSLFLPEKRDFFLERASAFEYSLGGRDALFYSRRIGIDDGRHVSVRGGARLVGRHGDWDIGLLSMQTAGTEERPSENFGVARLRRQVLNAQSHVGGILTSRITGRDDYNLVIGVDGALRLFGDDYLTVNGAQMFKREDGVTTPANDGARAFARARWERRGLDGLTYAIDISRAGRLFDPGVGFLRRNGYTRIGDQVSYGWRPDQGSALLHHAVRVQGLLYRRNADGRIESARIGPSWQFETRSGHRASIGAATVHERLDAPFRLSARAVVPEGRYRFVTGRASYGTPAGSLVQLSVGADGGAYFDGWRTSVRVRPGWTVSRHLDLGGVYRYDRVRFPDRDQRFDAHVLRLRGQLTATPDISANAFVQYNSAVDAVIANVRLRYNPREGNDLYLVYNHELNADGGRLDPTPPLTASRTVLLKYTHTFDLAF